MSSKRAKAAHKYEEERQRPPLLPLNEVQASYIEYINTKDVIIATGYPGTSKTYIPAIMASDALLKNQISRVWLSRPAVSDSESVGLLPGTEVDKLSMWMTQVVTNMRDRLGHFVYERHVAQGNIKFIPLEYIKGLSVEDGWLIIDEAEDITVKEAAKIVTRIGRGGKIIMSGDLAQSDLGSDSGLSAILDVAYSNPNLSSTTAVVDFNRKSDIVRGKACADWTMGFYSYMNRRGNKDGPI